MKTIIVLLIILAAALGLSRFEELSTQVTPQPTAAPTAAPTAVPFVGETEITGYFAAFDSEKADVALPPVMDHFSDFAPMLYRVNKDGSLGRHDIKNRDEIIAYAREKDVPIAPLLTDESDTLAIQKLLYNTRIQKTFINDLVKEAQDEEFSGWTIDIEIITSKDKNAFSEFTKNMAEALHENDLKLYMIAFGRDHDESYDPALAHDYKVFGEYADEVHLMTHNYSNKFTGPGGQTPLKDYRSVLKYALETIPREKIVIGLSTHGNDWGGEKVEGFTYPQIAERIEHENAEISYDKDESSMVAKYKIGDEEHIVMYENAKTTIEKMEIARNEFGISKFGIWRISAEDPEMWSQIPNPQ